MAETGLDNIEPMPGEALQTGLEDGRSDAVRCARTVGKSDVLEKIFPEGPRPEELTAWTDAQPPPGAAARENAGPRTPPGNTKCGQREGEAG